MINVLTSISNWGFIGKSVAVVYAAPVVTWGLGTIEGIARASFNGLATLYNKATGHQQEATERWNACKKDVRLGACCGGISAISLIPFIGFYSGTKGILEQCFYYYEYREAYQRALYTQDRENAMGIISEVDKSPMTLEALTRISQKLMTQKETWRVNDLLPQDQNKQASLIHYYWLYSIPYMTVEKSCQVIHFTAVKSYQLAVQLFKYGLIRKLVKSGYEAIRNEVAETSTDINANQNYHRIYNIIEVRGRK
jgi:hypothetical protein